MAPRPALSSRRRASAVLASLVAVFALVFAVLVAPVAGERAQAADLSKFDPGNIISDPVFYNSGAMTQAQIQTFLEARVRTCAVGASAWPTCLKYAKSPTSSKPADAMCKAYAGGGTESASTIIYKVAQACGVNPQVILVMLQKEQGLVTSVWPSEYGLNHAMGANCPDTTGCDTATGGLFTQIYTGVWQLKRYGNPPGTSQYFTWYAPGKTWNILYNPNTGCGRKSVYVRNQATANLYYYTPYTPNDAALRAGYGTGDGCSSYGNRNFYNYFTDWFGSTQVNSNLVFSVGRDIYVVSGTMKYHILLADWPNYQKTFGAPTAVSDSYLSLFTDGGAASSYLLNSDTGDVAYLQDGATHRFPTCTVVTMWGGSCTTLTRISGADFARIKKGAQMSAFATTGGYVGLMASGTFQPYYDPATLAVIAGGSPYAPTLPAAAATGLTMKPVRFAPGKFMTVAGDNRVWLPTMDGRLIYLQSWATGREFGMSASLFRSSVPAAAVAGYTKSAALSSFVTCNGALSYAASGKLQPVAAGGDAGFPVTELDAATCATFTAATGTATGVYVQATGTREVYAATGGIFRHITSMTQLVQLSGQSSPRVLQISAQTLALTPHSAAYLSPATLVVAAGSPHVYLVDDARLLHLPSWAMAAAAGLPTTATTVTAATIASYTTAPGSLTPFIRCGDTLYIAASGKYSAVTSGDPAGNAVTQLAPATCARLSLGGAAVAGKVVLSDGKTWAVASGNGFARYTTSAAAATAVGGTLPPVLTVATAYLATLPQPTAT